MIIVCKNCKASFLVSASIFSGGPRRVKCKRCGESWLADLPSKTKHDKKKTESKAKSPTKDQNAPESKPLTLEEEAPQASAFNKEKIKKIAFMAGLGLTGTVVFFGLLFIVLQNQIVQIFPHTENIYISLRLAKAEDPRKLLLQKVSSVRRYQDGAMRLIIEGEVYNTGIKKQRLPIIVVDAISIGKQTIESWHIEPPQATIGAGATVPFVSAILYPKEMVVEVNLRFVVKSHDK
ncbi:MAG TPA: hypothetical protein DD400_01670 [Rhodospirillaceae bacterium]|nr:hypothetical protein [Rhodospirillaceae bacterium]